MISYGVLLLRYILKKTHGIPQSLDMRLYYTKLVKKEHGIFEKRITQSELSAYLLW